MTDRKPGRPRTPPSTHQSVRLDLRVTPALAAALRRAAQAAGSTLAELARSRLAADGAEDGAIRAAWREGYEAALREAGARVEQMRRGVPWETKPLHPGRERRDSFESAKLTTGEFNEP